MFMFFRRMKNHVMTNSMILYIRLILTGVPRVGLKFWKIHCSTFFLLIDNLKYRNVRYKKMN